MEKPKRINMKMECLLLVILVSVVLGCATPLHSVYPKREVTMSYGIGEEKTSYTGSPFIIVGNFYTRPAYRPRYAFQPPQPGLRKVSEINPSQVWLVRGYRSDGTVSIFCPDYGWGLALDIFEDGTLTSSPWKNITQGDITMVQADTWKLPEKRLFEKIPAVPDNRPDMDNFRAELIYNGISKNTIRISYREFIKDMARPAFYQELNYDLDQSNLIQFRTLKIKVLQADNTTIKFIVIDDGGLPWVPKK